MGFNKDTVSNIFRFVDDNRLTPDRIYNVKESNITVNPNGQSKILALKGCRPRGVLNSAEKDSDRTYVLFCLLCLFSPPKECSKLL
jgi:hypothetical protein